MTPRHASHLLALLLPAALLGGAYVSQYGFGLMPCEMCLWQRWPHMTAIVLAGGALALQSHAAGRMLLMLAALAIAASGVIGAFHAGVEYKWWEGLTDCAVMTSGTSVLDAPFSTHVMRCDEAPWDLFGISLAGFNALFSIGGAALILGLLRRASRP